MKPIVQRVVQQSGWLAFFLFLFALLNGGYVCEALWQGSGLHGYIIVGGSKGGGQTIISAWSAFIQTIVFLVLALVLALVALRNNGFAFRRDKK